MAKVTPKNNSGNKQPLTRGFFFLEKKRVLLMISVLCMLLYGRGISNQFAMDDEFIGYRNNQIHQGIKAIPAILSSTYVDEGKQQYEYRPLVKVTYAIEYQLFGENPHVSHFINILIYILAVFLFFKLLLKMIPGLHPGFYLLSVLLFLVHPMHSEVVLSLKNRDGLMSFIFCLTSLSLFLDYIDKEKLKYLILGTICMLLAMMSKKDAMPFYLMIPFSVWFFRSVSWKKILGITGSLLFVPVVFRLITKAVSTKHQRVLLEWENPLFINSHVWERLPQGFYSFYFYLKMFFVPYPLLAYYGYNQVPLVGWSHPVVWLMVLLMLFFVYLAIRNFKQRPVWLYGLLLFVVCISMFTNVLVPVVGIVGERFSFISSIGLSMAAIAGLFLLFKVPMDGKDTRWASLPQKLQVILVLVGIIFSIQVISRNPAWKDGYTLYKTDSEKAPESAHLHTLLAALSIQRVQTEQHLSPQEKNTLLKEAEFHYQESLRLLPNYITSLNNIGMLYSSYFGQPGKSIPYLKKAIQLDTNYVEAYFNLASCQAGIGNFKGAEKHYKKAIEKDPTFKNAYSALAALMAKDKRFDDVITFNKQALEKGFQDEVVYINIGNAYYLKGDTLSAVPFLEQAIQKNQNNRNLNGFLAEFYKKKGDLTKANYYYDLMSRSQK